MTTGRLVDDSNRFIGDVDERRLLLCLRNNSIFSSAEFDCVLLLLAVESRRMDPEARSLFVLDELNCVKLCKRKYLVSDERCLAVLCGESGGGFSSASVST